MEPNFDKWKVCGAPRWHPCRHSWSLVSLVASLWHVPVDCCTGRLLRGPGPRHPQLVWILDAALRVRRHVLQFQRPHRRHVARRPGTCHTSRFVVAVGTLRARVCGWLSHPCALAASPGCVDNSPLLRLQACLSLHRCVSAQPLIVVTPLLLVGGCRHSLIRALWRHQALASLRMLPEILTWNPRPLVTPIPAILLQGVVCAIFVNFGFGSLVVLGAFLCNAVSPPSPPSTPSPPVRRALCAAE